MDMPANAVPPLPSDQAAIAAKAVVGTLRMARALAQSHRRIDLAGLDHEIGRLCATSLDLPPADGRAIRPLLATVLTELDGLSACVAALSEDGA
jgi:hypothetical protein